MSNNSELYSSHGHLSTEYLHNCLTFLLFGTLNGNRRILPTLPGKMHKSFSPAHTPFPGRSCISREITAYGRTDFHTLRCPGGALLTLISGLCSWWSGFYPRLQGIRYFIHLYTVFPPAPLWLPCWIWFSLRRRTRKADLPHLFPFNFRKFPAMHSPPAVFPAV